MLKEFSIKNYRSINEEVTFSMEADVDRVSENPSHILRFRDNALLRVGSMYGPNGGGKSNILKAMRLMRSIVVSGSVIGSEEDCTCVFSDDPVTELIAFFAGVDHDLGYKIRFSYAQGDPSGSIMVLSESIFALDDDSGEYEIICERNAKGEVISSESAILERYGGKSIGQGVSVLRFFYQFFYNEEAKPPFALGVLFELFKEIASFVWLSGYPSDGSYRSSDYFFADSVSSNKADLVRMLSSADIPVKDIEVEKANGRTKIHFIREFASNGSVIQKSIELSEESLGTQKLFDMLLMFLIRKKEGAIFLGDDINACLHPKLLSALIELFNSDPNGRSQLILNSHDIVNMNNRVFRRDEIWFVYRDEKYQTNIIPLSNITNYKGKQIRNDASYGKQYLEGKYGADPFIQKGLNWNE